MEVIIPPVIGGIFSLLGAYKTYDAHREKKNIINNLTEVSNIQKLLIDLSQTTKQLKFNLKRNYTILFIIDGYEIVNSSDLIEIQEMNNDYKKKFIDIADEKFQNYKKSFFYYLKYINFYFHKIACLTYLLSQYKYNDSFKIVYRSKIYRSNLINYLEKLQDELSQFLEIDLSEFHDSGKIFYNEIENESDNESEKSKKIVFLNFNDFESSEELKELLNKSKISIKLKFIYNNLFTFFQENYDIFDEVIDKNFIEHENVKHARYKRGSRSLTMEDKSNLTSEISKKKFLIKLCRLFKIYIIVKKLVNLFDNKCYSYPKNYIIYQMNYYNVFKCCSKNKEYFNENKIKEIRNNIRKKINEENNNEN